MGEKLGKILSPELHRHPGPFGHVSSSERRLLAGYAAAHGIEFETGVLSSLYRAAHRLAHE